jgi:glycosyltransferase involved in cell wall biosynthesis
MTNARFLLIGDDISGRDNAYKNSVLDYVKNCPIADRIEFCGWQENMDELWCQIDCLVHTAEREPFGRVIIEAMANKIPVVAVDSCGPGEIIRNGRTGILVPADDAKALGEAMLKISSDKKFADELANAGFKCAVSEFTCEQTAGHIKDIYNEVLSVRD